jgi:hypothetical protein
MEDAVIGVGIKYLKSKRFNVADDSGRYILSEFEHYLDIWLNKDYFLINISSSIYSDLKNILSTDNDTIKVIIKLFLSDYLSIPIEKLKNTKVYLPFNLSYSGITTYNIHYGNG